MKFFITRFFITRFFIAFAVLGFSFSVAVGQSFSSPTMNKGYRGYPKLTNNKEDVRKAFASSYEFESSKNYKQAIEALEAVYSPTSYSINLRLGWLCYLASDFTKSKSYYETAMRLESSSIEALLGYLYPIIVLQDWKKVLSIHEKIVSIDPYYTPSLYQIGYISFVNKKYTRAESFLKRVLKLYPFDFDTNLLLAQIYLKAGRIRESKETYEKALEINPYSKEALDAMGNF